MSPHWIISAERGNTRVNANAAAGLVRAIGDPDHTRIVSAILAVVRDAGVYSEACSFYAFEPSAPPRHIASANVRDTALSNSIAERYVHEYYKYDSNRLFMTVDPCDLSHVPLVVTRQTSDKINCTDYRRACYDSVGIADRLSVVVPLKFHSGLTISIYRPRTEGLYQESDIHGFQETANLVGQAAARHYALCTPNQPDLSTLFDSKLAFIGPNLTRREYGVILRILRGMTVAQIAKDLDIKPTSVLTYRNRAYQRLGIRLRSELCALLLGGTVHRDRLTVERHANRRPSAASNM
jgi:DNA-binding CsgD family transcriptional regulator